MKIATEIGFAPHVQPQFFHFQTKLQIQIKVQKKIWNLRHILTAAHALKKLKERVCAVACVITGITKNALVNSPIKGQKRITLTQGPLNI